MEMSEENVRGMRARVVEALKNMRGERTPERYVCVVEEDLQRVLEYVERLVKEDKPELTRAELPKVRDYLASMRDNAIKAEP